MYVESLFQFGSVRGSVNRATSTPSPMEETLYAAAALVMSPRRSSSASESESTTSPGGSARNCCVLRAGVPSAALAGAAGTSTARSTIRQATITGQCFFLQLLGIPSFEQFFLFFFFFFFLSGSELLLFPLFWLPDPELALPPLPPLELALLDEFELLSALPPVAFPPLAFPPLPAEVDP